jgi:hypothetical protein
MGFGLCGVGVLIEPDELEVGRSKFLGDDLVDQILHPLLGGFETLILRLR